MKIRLTKIKYYMINNPEPTSNTNKDKLRQEKDYDYWPRSKLFGVLIVSGINYIALFIWPPINCKKGQAGGQIYGQMNIRIIPTIITDNISYWNNLFKAILSRARILCIW